MTPSSRDEAAERIGVFVVRAWLEPGRPPPGLRMRVTRTVDVQSPLSEVSATTDVEEICDDLRRWLQEFTSRSAS